MLHILAYDRGKAIDYAIEWALKRNPRYLDFHGIGGDCTNFVSQCIYAGSGIMNYTPTFGWYYSTASNRSPSWSGVQYLYNFLTGNDGQGPYATEEGLDAAEPGDIIQLGRPDGTYYHSLFLTKTGHFPDISNILVATHSDDALNRPLYSYEIHRLRLLHIRGVRKYT